MKRYIFLILAIVLSINLSACGGSKSGLESYSAWETEKDEDNSFIRWTFSDGTLKMCTVLGGEELLPQTFNYTLNGRKLSLTGDYATLEYTVSLSGDTLKVNTGEKNLVFHGVE